MNVPALRAYDRGTTHHETVPVESAVTGEILANICLTCGEQLAADETSHLVGVSEVARTVVPPPSGRV